MKKLTSANVAIETAQAVCNAFVISTRTTRTETTSYVLLPLAGHETFMLRAANEAVAAGVVFS